MADHVIHHHTEHDGTGGASMAVALLALLLLVALAVFAFRYLPFQGNAAATPDNDTQIDVTLPGNTRVSE